MKSLLITAHRPLSTHQPRDRQTIFDSPQDTAAQDRELELDFKLSDDLIV